jgi:hypothetical protein
MRQDPLRKLTQAFAPLRRRQIKAFPAAPSLSGHDVNRSVIPTAARTASVVES